jgi:hypothetical protein
LVLFCRQVGREGIRNMVQAVGKGKLRKQLFRFHSDVFITGGKWNYEKREFFVKVTVLWPADFISDHLP